MPEFCEVGYSATLVRAQGHNFKGWGKVLAMEGSECTIKWQTEKKPSSNSITDVFLTAFHSIPTSDSASEAALYPESDHEATDPKTSLRSAAQQNTQMQSDPAKLAHFFCSTTCHPRGCAAVSDSHSDQVLRTLLPNTSVLASNAHFLRLSQPAQSVPSSRFLAQTLFRGIIRCTKTSGFATERWF